MMPEREQFLKTRAYNYILNKNSLTVKKCEVNQKQDYKPPKLLILRKAKNFVFLIYCDRNDIFTGHFHNYN